MTDVEQPTDDDLWAVFDRAFEAELESNRQRLDAEGVLAADTSTGNRFAAVFQHPASVSRGRGMTRGERDSVRVVTHEQLDPERSPRTQPASICHSGSLRLSHRRGPLWV